jgi:hypothetical protein
MEFIYFKSVVGIALVLAFIIAFVNLLSIENTELQIRQILQSRKM